MNAGNYCWAVQELDFSYHAGETILNTIHIYIYMYSHYDNFSRAP